MLDLGLRVYIGGFAANHVSPNLAKPNGCNQKALLLLPESYKEVS